LVLAVLSALPDHPTVEQIGRRLESAGTPVAPPTLYQTLSRLCQAGLLSSFVDANGRLRFDTNLAFHHHVRCLECGLILDVSVGEQEEELEGLATTANKHLPEWEVATVRLELQGICPSCLVAGGGRSRCRNS
jgi:Fe2+ or Zn2+ uptake regulation protein